MLPRCPPCSEIPSAGYGQPGTWEPLLLQLQSGACLRSCVGKPGTEESVGLCLERFASWMCLGLEGGAGCPPEQGEGSQTLCGARGSPSHVLSPPGWLKSPCRRWVASPCTLGGWSCHQGSLYKLRQFLGRASSIRSCGLQGRRSVCPRSRLPRAAFLGSGDSLLLHAV